MTYIYATLYKTTPHWQISPFLHINPIIWLKLDRQTCKIKILWGLSTEYMFVLFYLFWCGCSKTSLKRLMLTHPDIEAGLCQVDGPSTVDIVPKPTNTATTWEWGSTDCHWGRVGCWEKVYDEVTLIDISMMFCSKLIWTSNILHQFQNILHKSVTY